MNFKLRTPNSHLITLFILAAILFFFKLGSFSLYDAVECIYGEFVKQIHLTGDWITMHYNGAIIFDKPPLFFWLQTIATFIFGFNEFALRFWAAICGIATVLVTYQLGKSFYNAKVGFFAGIIVMTTYQYLIQSRIAEMDILLVFLITAAMLAFWQAYQGLSKYYYWLFYLLVSLAAVTKGLLGLALPGLAILLFLGIKKDLKHIKAMQLVPGIVIFLTIGCPWYIAEWLIHGQKFTEFVLGFLFISRFSAVVSGHPGPWYYYFLALLLGFAPWSHFIPQAINQTWKNRANNPELLTLCLIVPTFVIFSIAKTKLPSYMLPLYPFIAIMIAKLWHDFFEQPEKFKKSFLLANIIFGLIIFLIIIGFILIGNQNNAIHYQAAIGHLAFLARLFVGLNLLTVLLFFFKRYYLSFIALPISVFIMALVLTTQTLPLVEYYKGTKEMGQRIKREIKPDQIVAAYNVGNRPSVVFYSPKPVQFLKTEKALKQFLQQNKGFCFTTKNDQLMLLPAK